MLEYHTLDYWILSNAACSLEEKKEFLPLVEYMIEMTEMARRDGILRLEAELPDMSPPLLRKGMEMAVDGNDPVLIHKVLYYNAVCGGAKGKELFGNVLIIEGVHAIQEGQNPRMVKQVLFSLFGEEFMEEAVKYQDSFMRSARLDKVAAAVQEGRDRPAEPPCTLLEEPVDGIHPISLQILLAQLDNDELALALAKASGKTRKKFLHSMGIGRACDIVDKIADYEKSATEQAVQYMVKAQESIRGKIEKMFETGQAVRKDFD